MLFFTILTFLALGVGGQSDGGSGTESATESAAVVAPAAQPSTVVIGSGVVIGDPNTVVVEGKPFAAEDQTASGKFTTAGEVKPILEATRGNWIAVREYDGQDLVYLTHLIAWRCGLHEVRVGFNGAAPEVWELPRCQTEFSTPNAIPDDQALMIYRSYELGSIQSMQVEILLDDMSEMSGSYARKDVRIP
ncbi:hypothetical protein KO498_16050 [Lentibacter algarum]|uniref:hypothetical protein n=1 Tax=Lentibacter algarum TaxID=576131 RepID=UPI001C09605B|nr:hypothetical protein [Lentibacter algarum]MBU2983319.1 hypothetical protein [Lentibacter algarum]